ncbi:MAG: GLPGLI family protein [Flavobacterium sp.]
MKKKYLSILFLFFTISFFAQKKNVVVTYKVAYHEDELMSDGMKDLPSSLMHIKTTYEYALSNADRYVFSLHIADKKSIFMFDQKKSNTDSFADNTFVLTLCGYLGFVYNANDSIYKNLPYLGNKVYKKTPQITNWTLHQESKYIGKHLCFKATNTKVVDNGNGKVFNHPVVAWYCPEIPMQFGPNGYGNLPGLIIELQVRNVVYGVSHIDFNPVSIFDFSEFDKIKVYNELQIKEIENEMD